MTNLKNILLVLLFSVNCLSFGASNKCNALFKVPEKTTEDVKIEFSKAQFDRQLKLDELMPDRFIMRRDWGTKLLSEFDPTWKDPEYIKTIHELMTPQITGYGGKTKELFYKYQNLFGNFLKGQIRNIFSSGTDANNYLFIYARTNFKLNHNREPKNMKFITFSDMYGGSFGPISEAVHDQLTYKINRPVYRAGRTLSETEMNELTIKESEALAKIEKLIQTKSSDVGAIMLEPISVTRGIFMYRTRFLEQLQDLARHHNVPIFADEIYTGGGRSGKFWAFQHYIDEKSYDPFTPDLVTFGKGFGVSGIFQPYKDKRNSSLKEDTFRMLYPPTTSINSLALAQSYQIVKTIWERRLDLNAAKVGQHYMNRLNQAGIAYKEHAKNLDKMAQSDQTGRLFKEHYKEFSNEEKRTSGIGLMFWYSDYYFSKTRGQTNDHDTFRGDFEDRKSPILTLSEEDIDYALSQKLNWKLSKNK